MATAILLEAELREDEGKGASRRLRHEGKVPAIIYGGERKPRSITLSHNDLLNHARNEGFFAQVVKIKVGKTSQSAVVKDMQMHPAKPRILHVDFQRVMDDVEIRITVPLHFINEEESPGVKMQGGIVQRLKNDVDIACLPGDLPEFIEVNVGAMNLDDMLHMSDLVLPKGVAIPELAQSAEHDQPVISIHLAKVEVEPEEDVAAPADDAAAEPEADGDGDDA